MSEWKKVKLKDICEITSSKRIFFSEYVDIGIPFYRSKEIIELSNGQSISEPLFISETKYNDIRMKFGVPKENDILLTSVGSIGIPYIVKKDDVFYFKDGNLTWLRNFKDFVFPTYLLYWLKSDETFNILNNIALGAAQKALTIVKLKDVEISLPPITTQYCIANILSRYDSLIENYQKQIKLLEEAAQRLYKEWFVDLRFPGHENTKIVDGVPEGWEKTNINNMLTFHRGYDLTHKEFVDGPYPVVGSTSIIGCHNKYKIEGPGIVTGRSGSLGVYQLIWDNFWPHNTSLYISDFKGHEVFFIYCMLKTIDFTTLNSGGAIPSLNRNTLSNILVVEPPKNLQQDFSRKAIQLFKKQKSLQSQIRLLTEARDRLLPKLMSGEIAV